jgi:hypothetical protein
MKKCKCGHHVVADNAKSCPNCGNRFASDGFKLALTLVAVAVVLGVVGRIADSGDVAVTPAPQPSLHVASTSRSISTGNIANERLSALSQRLQAVGIGQVVNKGCEGNRAF